MSYGISGNKYRGAHLELTKKPKEENKDQPLFSPIIKSVPTTALINDSDARLEEVPEKSVKFRLPTPRKGSHD